MEEKLQDIQGRKRGFKKCLIRIPKKIMEE